jgi:hypothetical protein
MWEITCVRVYTFQHLQPTVLGIHEPIDNVLGNSFRNDRRSKRLRQSSYGQALGPAPLVTGSELPALPEHPALELPGWVDVRVPVEFGQFERD